MSFDWQRFLAAHGVHYVTRGPNVSKGRAIAVHCPFCGDADPSQHLNIALRGSGWWCWRNRRAHSGRSRARLIQALLRCSMEEAKRLSEEEAPPPPLETDLTAQLGALLGVSEGLRARPSGPLAFPPEVKPLGPTVLCRPFWTYLTDRGYTKAEAGWLATAYELRYATQGPYRYRLVIPVTDPEGALMTWTARSVQPGAEIRYKTLSTLPPPEGRPGLVARRAPGDLLLGLPLLLQCPNPEVLVLVEGPFDAFRISALGHEKGVYGTCLFGLNLSSAQAELVARLMGRFRKCVLMLDPDARLLVPRLREALYPQAVHVEFLPDTVDDPGALPRELAAELFTLWLAPTREKVHGWG